jgi:hypothetical protein
MYRSGRWNCGHKIRLPQAKAIHSCNDRDYSCVTPHCQSIQACPIRRQMATTRDQSRLWRSFNASQLGVDRRHQPALVSSSDTMTRHTVPDLLPGTLDLLILRTLQTRSLHGWAI